MVASFPALSRQRAAIGKEHHRRWSSVVGQSSPGNQATTVFPMLYPLSYTAEAVAGFEPATCGLEVTVVFTTGETC